ncbi:hypothetical protein J6590_023199 [Homalodisca vitripennis]|nr:hypothetical protein J6590_023199 [Homalodisca vitripennis]
MCQSCINADKKRRAAQRKDRHMERPKHRRDGVLPGGKARGLPNGATHAGIPLQMSYNMSTYYYNGAGKSEIRKTHNIEVMEFLEVETYYNFELSYSVALTTSESCVESLKARNQVSLDIPCHKLPSTQTCSLSHR